jgi:hypothetical protein
MPIIIEGNAAYIAQDTFRPKIEGCLTLLRTRAATYHGWISSNVVKIRAFSRSGADISHNSIDIASLTFDASATWLASVLVHETKHIMQFRAGSDYTGTAAELECNRYQLEALRLMNAPASEISYLLAQDGNHFDLNGDGRYDAEDYRLRNW